MGRAKKKNKQDLIETQEEAKTTPKQTNSETTQRIVIDKTEETKLMSPSTEANNSTQAYSVDSPCLIENSQPTFLDIIDAKMA